MKLWIIVFGSFILSVNLSLAEESTVKSKIIFLLPLGSKSHKNVFDPLINALVERGHHVTVVSPLKSPTLHPNLRDIQPMPLEEVSRSRAFSGGNMFENRKKGKLAALWNFDNAFITEVCHKFYQNEEIQEILKTKEHFDLAFVNAVPNQCTLGFVHYLGIPHINVATLPLPNRHVASVGGYFPTSYVPSAFGPYLNLMNFQDRVLNFITDILSGHMYYQSQSADIYRQYLGPTIPSVNEIDKNASMVFMNTNMLLTFKRPLLPNIVEVGGMHCRERSVGDLPKDLKELLDNAKDGFIYFSLGSVIRTQNMPAEVRQKFLNVFAKLKQLVIWKWDNEEEADLPPNVYIRKWLPQQNILAHPNLKLFISHGGLLSSQESVYYGKPLLGLPLYVDQDLNILQAESLGFGLTLEITDFSEEELEEKVQRLISDSRFSDRAKHYSRIFKDQLQTPVERAVYWSEYVIRHKGAYHLSSPARNLNTLEYFSIDVVAFLLTVSLVILFVLKVVLTQMFKLVFRQLQSSRKVKSQ